MEWEFTSEQVVKGEVGYALEDFRRDLAREVRMNIAGAFEDDFRLIYDFCYWLATSKPLPEFVASFAYDPPTIEFLESLREPMQGNIEMLGAILQRLIMDRVEAGMPLEQALEAVAEHHRQVATAGIPPAAGYSA